MTLTGFNGFVLGKVLSPVPEPLLASFDRLEPDSIEYRDTGFQSRHRCFSTYRVEGDELVRDDAVLPLFNGEREFHKKYEAKVPAPDKELTETKAVEAFLAHLIPALPLRRPEAYVFGVNQVRVIADETHMGSPAPGLHQDGYVYSCHLNIARQNVSGGASLLATSADPKDIFIEQTLQPNEFVFFNDRKLYHTATPITQRIVGRPTWRDMIIVDVIERS